MAGEMKFSSCLDDSCSSTPVDKSPPEHEYDNQSTTGSDVVDLLEPEDPQIIARQNLMRQTSVSCF